MLGGGRRWARSLRHLLRSCILGTQGCSLDCVGCSLDYVGLQAVRGDLRLGGILHAGGELAYPRERLARLRVRVGISSGLGVRFGLGLGSSLLRECLCCGLDA